MDKELTQKLAEVMSKYNEFAPYPCEVAQAKRVIDIVLDDLAFYAWDHGVISPGDWHSCSLKEFLDEYKKYLVEERN